jgi:hypothetical protein
LAQALGQGLLPTWDACQQWRTHLLG